MLSLTTAAHRWRTLLGTALSLVLGTGLLAATAVVIASATAQAPQRYAAAQVLVSSPTVYTGRIGIPEHRPWPTEEAERLAAGLRALSGVRTAVADRTFPARVVGGPETEGHPWSSLALSGERLLDGSAPTGPDEIAGPGLRTGAVMNLFTTTGIRPVRVSGTVSGDPLVHGIYLADDVAADLASGSRVIGVVIDDGAEPATVAAAVSEVVGSTGAVHAGAGRARLETEEDSRTRWVGAQFLIVLGTIAGFVSVFVVATTFAFVVTQRRREIALYRAVGATPGQVRRMLLGEAAVVGLLASTAGGVAGAALAPLLGEWMVNVGMQPLGWQPRTVFLPTAAAIAAGVLVALLGVWSASRRAARIRPVEALRESSVERRPMSRTRWLVGVASLAGGVAFAALTPVAAASTLALLAVLAVIAFVVGAASLAPVYVPALVGLLCRPWRRHRGPTAELVREQSVVGVRRVASTTAPVLVTVTFAVLITGVIEMMDDALAAGDAAAQPAPVVVSPAQGLPGVTDAAVALVRDSGVSRSVAVLPTTVVVDGRQLNAAGVDDRVAGRPSGPSLDPPDAIAVSATLAAERGWRTGTVVPLIWADGRPGRATIGAVLVDAPAPVILSLANARAHDPGALVTAVYADGRTPEDLAATVADQGAAATTGVAYQNAEAAEEERLVRLFSVVMLGLVLGFTALAIANTLVMSTAERRRDFAVLRLSGAGVSQVLRVVAVEAVLLVLIGTVIGAVAAVPGLLGTAAGLADDFGVDVSITVPWRTVLGVVAGCLAISLVASLAPALAAMRGSAVDHVGDRR
ncbi:MAG TPA: FtsX-like permease family protein [Pseudonocardiaceae bacterium]